MNYLVRVTLPGFMIGTTLYDEGSEVEVNAPTKDYLVASGAVEVIREVHYATDQAGSPGYSRRDMEAGEAPAPAPAPKPVVQRKKVTKKKAVQRKV